MSIVNSIVSEDTLRRDGRRNIVERHTDHLGVAHTVRYIALAGQDIGPLLSQHAGMTAGALRDGELEDAVNVVDDGGDPSTIAVEHSTRNQMRRFLVGHFLRSQARAAIRVIRLIDDLRDNQLRSLLGVGQAKVAKIRSRVSSLKRLKTSLEADDLEVENG